MILEAFSQVLHDHYPVVQNAEEVLNHWLELECNRSNLDDSPVTRVIQTEIVMVTHKGKRFFESNTPSGETLLRSLHNYCRSYDHWQFTRWLHERKATDFAENPL